MIAIEILKLFTDLKEAISFRIEESYFRSDLFVDVRDCCGNGDAVIVFSHWNL